ncbi:ATP-binding protein [Halobacillus sp. H74]|uniref:ATP-binding protein n=1 Tax=Halobacillus sp. H74 TaxID=3457436 RepID=UPI003FCE54F3
MLDFKKTQSFFKSISKMEFPIKYYEENKIFAHDGSSWAYFEIDGYEYDYLSIEDKLRLSRDFEAFFAATGYDTHLLIVPQYHSIQETHDQYKKKISGDLKEAAYNHLDEAVPVIESNIGAEATDDHYYVGVKLPASDYDGSDIKGLIEQFKEMKNKLFTLMNLENPDITKEEYERAYRKSRSVESSLRQNLKSYSGIRPINERDCQWLIKRNFFRSIAKTPIIDDFRPTSQTTEKGKRVFAPELLRLSEGTIDNQQIGHLGITQMVDGEPKTGYTTFLTVSYIPEEIGVIGDEWIYINQIFDFPVETSIRTRTINHESMKGKILNKKKALDSEREHAEGAGSEAPVDIQENDELVRDLEQRTKTTRMPTLEMTVVLCVSAESPEELQNRVKSIKDEYADLNFEVEQPGSDQWILFNEFLPGSDQYIDDYLQIVEPAQLAAGMFGATKNIGDGEGFYYGMELTQKNPVFIDPSLAAKNVVSGSKTRTLNASFIGPPGGGKSFAANLMIYLAVLSGGKALIIDPKGERSNWPEDLVYMKDHVNVLTLTANEENRGRLDPFEICEDIDEAQALAVGILSFLTQRSFEDYEFTIINEGVERVAKSSTPCMMNVVEELLNHEEEEGQKVGKQLKAFTKLSFAKLLFGNGKTHQSINTKYAINILQIQNMKMPPKSKSIKNYDFQERLSMAMMFPIGEFAYNFMKISNKIFKIVFFDESWFMEKTDIGTDIIDRLHREGRYHNAGVYRATQAVKDVDDERKAMIGMKFVFQNNNVEECQNALKFLGLDQSDEHNIKTIQDLDLGQCLFQDIRGRTAQIQIQHLFKDLEKAFDTRPPSQDLTEETQDEEKQELVHV